MFRIESVEIIRISSRSKAVAELLSLEPIGAEHIKTKAGTAELVAGSIKMSAYWNKMPGILSTKVVFAL